MGYEINVIKGYNFDKLNNVFEKFVDNLHKIKNNSKGLVKTITKLILNSGFGRYGMSIYKPKVDIVNKEKLDFILSVCEINSLLELNSDSFLVSYNSEISKKICEKSGLDYIKVLNYRKSDHENIQKFEDISISTAAAITSYARIHITKLKLEILNKGGKLYYSDTDSIVTDLELDEEFVGKNLGQLKREDIKKAFFISNKTYILVLQDDTQIIKAKGVISKNLTLSDFEEMYYHKKDLLTEKNDTVIDFSKGTVNFKTKDVLLRHDSYCKREKIFDKDGL